MQKLSCGVRMNTAEDSNQFCVEFMYRQEKHQLLRWIGGLNRLWLSAFVHPKTGETQAWILFYVNRELFNQVLADFAQEFGLGANNRIILAVDRAGWESSKSWEIPEGLHLTFLPSDSPELQPAERLWTLVDEPIAHQSFETRHDLEDVLFHRCQSLLQQPDFIRGLTGFHWWLKTGA